jgi:outer membrane protein
MSNKLARLLLATALFSLPALAQTNSAAAAPATAPAGGTKIAIITIQDAIVATNEGQRDFEALAKKFEPKRTELKNLNDEIESLKKQLNAQDSKLSEDARASLVKSIESKTKTLQRNQEDAQNEFQQQQAEIAQRILQKMGPVIDKYAKDNSLGLIIDASNPWPQGQVLWANEGVNITKAIVDGYNTVSGVAAPAPSAPSAAKPAAPKPAAPKPPATTPQAPPKN